MTSDIIQEWNFKYLFYPKNTDYFKILLYFKTDNKYVGLQNVYVYNVESVLAEKEIHEEKKR